MKKTNKKKNKPVYVNELAYVLRDGKWKTRAQIRKITGLTDRQIRALRNESAGTVIYGQKGFRLTSRAARSEVNDCVSAVRGQIVSMGIYQTDVLRVAKGEKAKADDWRMVRGKYSSHKYSRKMG